MKVLGIFAHREDQIVFGWPIFQDRTIDRYLIICADDSDKRGQKPLQQSCDHEGIQLIKCLNFPNVFFQITKQTNKISLKEIAEILQKVVAETVNKVRPDYIFCHNPFGEYGHFDHRLVFEIIYNSFLNQSILITDICAYSSGTLATRTIPRMWQGFYANSKKFGIVKPDHNFYKRNKAIYEQFEMWTGNQYLNLPIYPKLAATIYELEADV